MYIELNLKEGQKGDWELSRFKVTSSEAAMHRLRCMINNYPERAITDGTYWRLTKSGYVYVTNRLS